MIGSCLAKITLYGGNALLHKSRNLRLIPTDCFWIGEIKDSILHRHSASSIHHVQASVDYLREETVLGCEIRQLPKTGMKTLLGELLQHADRILKTVFGKLIVTLPVNTEPSCVEVYHVRRNLMGTQLPCYFQAFLLGEISNTAHPGTKAPKRQHR